MKMKVSSFLGILFLWLFFSTASVHAGTMDVTAFPLMAGDCVASLGMQHSFTATGTTVDITSPDRDVFNLVLYDGHGDAFAYIGISVGIGTWNASNHPWNYPILVPPKSRPFTLVIYDNPNVVSTSFADLAGAQNGTIVDTVHYDPASYGVCGFLPVYTAPVIEQGQVPVFNDGRINDWDAASPIVVFGHDFEDGRGLVIYSPEGLLLLALRPEDLIPCPSEVTLLASENGVSLFYLPSCEYQVMAGSLDGAKTYTLIFSEFYPSGYRSYED